VLHYPEITPKKQKYEPRYAEGFEWPQP
jgi:hypothetical protein